MAPVHPLEHDLALVGPIENQRDAVLEMPRLVEDPTRRLPVEEMPNPWKVLGLR